MEDQQIEILEQRPDLSLVRFPDGTQRWVENNQITGGAMSGKQEKKLREAAKEQMLERAIALQKAKDEVEAKKVRTQCYYFRDVKGNQYPVTEDIYQMLEPQIGSMPKGQFVFSFVDHTKEKTEWATITFPLADVWFVLTTWEKILPLEEVKKIEELGGSIEGGN